MTNDPINSFIFFIYLYMDDIKRYALVTGASSGIGREIAKQLSQRGYQLLLVARSGDQLRALADEIGAEYFVQDLSLPGGAAAVYDHWRHLPVSILINNAGYGLWGDFEELPIKEQQLMLQLNVAAVIELTHHFMPVLRQQQQSYILNVASTAAYQAVPTLALYAASKAFVLSFSRALRYELKDTNISVSCLCPGPTDTGFADRAGMSALAELAEKFNMQPGEVAALAIKGLFKGKAEVIPGLLNRLAAFSTRLLPKALIENITAGLYRKKCK